MIHLPGQIADRDAPLHFAHACFDRGADARRKPAGDEQRRERRDEQRGAEPEIHVVLQRREQSRGVAHDNASLLDAPGTVDGVHIRKRQVHARCGIGNHAVGRKRYRHVKFLIRRQMREKGRIDRHPTNELEWAARDAQ